MREPAQIFHEAHGGEIEHAASVLISGPEGEYQLDVNPGDTFGGILEKVNERKKETGFFAKAASKTLTFTTVDPGSEARIRAEVLSGKFKIHKARDGRIEKFGTAGLSNLVTFLWYFVPTVLIVSVMLSRIALLKISMFVVRGAIAALLRPMHATTQWIRDKIDAINSQQVVFFTRGDNVAHLNSAMLYVKNNEHTNRIRVVTVVIDDDEVPANLKDDIAFLDEVYPTIDIDFEVIKGRFGPALVDKLSKQWGIPKNFIP